MARLDPHSYADDTQATADVLEWRATVDFARRALACEATLRFQRPVSGGPLDLDTRDLEIQSVVDQSGQVLSFELAPPEPILGARLTVHLPAGSTFVRIAYRTSPAATALQWLDAAQTAGGRLPFLYTQCQPIHARSVVPLQDTPRTRLRFEAELDVPDGFVAVMAARSLGSERHGDRTLVTFSMSEPISPYLFAFAVGDLASRELGPRSRVWAEPGLVEQAAWEFADTEQMLATGEALFGAYAWERYDILVLPPAFPYGGMENPRLTFLTPTVLAGDRSLVAVIAHELAHSWTGNLISNANAEHFWLNEGWTTYAERRIVEALWGPDSAALEWALGRRDLDEAIQRLDDDGKSQLTRLRTTLVGVDPDDSFTVVPYEKGALLLRAFEDRVGRAAFDVFIREYIETFRFGVLTTEEFLLFLEQHLPAEPVEAVQPRAWLYVDGLPATAPAPRSQRLDAISALGERAPSATQAAAWSAVEWQLYLAALPSSMPFAFLVDLDERFGLTAGRNYDVVEKWLVLAVHSDYQPAFARLDDVLSTIGRMKYLRPLYRALDERDPAAARRVFERNLARYHPIARRVIASMLGVDPR